MAQLYAACRHGGALVVKHVQLAPHLQAGLDSYFQAQEAAFMDGIANEVLFNGDWKPDEDEVLVATGIAEAQVLLAAADQNAVALPPLNAAGFETENVKALFTALGPATNQRLLIQSFSPQQILSTKLALLFEGNVFRRVTEPAFTLGSQLVATVDAAGAIKFKSYALVRRIFDLTALFRQATDAELAAFCAHGHLSVADANAFMASADEGIRKAVHTLTTGNVFAQNSVTAIQAQATAIGFPVQVVTGRLVVPSTRKEIKTLLSFLLNKVYLGSLDRRLFITNSTRPL